jgi:hypothetical protein
MPPISHSKPPDPAGSIPCKLALYKRVQPGNSLLALESAHHFVIVVTLQVSIEPSVLSEVRETNHCTSLSTSSWFVCVVLTVFIDDPPHPWEEVPVSCIIAIIITVNILCPLALVLRFSWFNIIVVIIELDGHVLDD